MIRICENYAVAAFRHLSDGELLLEHNRKNNAICHLAFSAECSLKALWKQIIELDFNSTNLKTLKSHDGEQLQQWLVDYCNWCGVLDPRIALLSAFNTIPPVLFSHHPDRRYFLDQDYQDSEIDDVLQYVHQLSACILELVLNGQLEI